MSLSNNFPTIRPTLNLDFANSGVLDPRITFTRTTTATYYDAETVALAEQNLLLQSQTLEQSPWAATIGGTGVTPTVTANAGAAPDGTTTAERIQFSLAGGTATADISRWRQSIALPSSATYAFSIWLKSYDGVSSYSVHLVGADGLTSTAQTVTGSWTRFSVIASGSGTVAIAIGLRGGQTPVNSDTADVLAWGAQLEQRSSVTAYTATTTQAITNYIPQLMTAAAGQARFDYDPITRAAKGLLIEEARTNLTTYSEQFDNAAWVKFALNTTGTPPWVNVGIAPDGTQTADKFTENTVAAFHYMDRTLTISASTAYTFSVYLKAGERTFGGAHIYENGAARGCSINLTTGALGTPYGGATASAVSVGNGWYRLSVTITSSTTTALPAIYLSNTNALAAYTGDGWSGIFVWGAQLEAGAFATSYIPTVASTVQRTNEIATMTGTNFSSWYTQGSGTLYEDCFWNGTSGYTYTLFVDGGNTNNIIATNANSNTFAARVRINSTDQLDMTFASVLLRGNTVKSAIAFSTNNFAVTANGLTPQTDSAGLVPVVDRFVINNSGTRTVKSIRYYPVRLTDSQLQNLTKS